LMLAVSSINNLGEPTGQALNLLSGGIYGGLAIICYELLTIRRRMRLPDLIEQYVRSQKTER
jgi:nitrate reductase gamma subunit